MSQTSYHQTLKLKARLWSHIHIGCGKSLGRWEYFFSKDRERLAFLDYEKLAEEALKNEELIDKLAEAASADPAGSLQKFLSTYEENDRQLKERISCLSGLRCLPAAVRAFPPEKRSIRKLRLFLGSPNCYIPGGSIKGALRTAYLSEILAGSREKEEVFARQKLADDFANCKSLKESLSRTFRPGSPYTRLFENLIVRDSASFSYDSMGIACIGLFGSGKRNSRINEKARQGLDSDEYAEVLLAGSSFEVEAVLRTCRRYSLPLKDLRELFAIADRFYRRVWQEELANQEELKKQKQGVQDALDFYQSQLSLLGDDYYLLRLGYGSGQMSQSVYIPYRDYHRQEYGEAADRPLRHAHVYRRYPKLKSRQPYPYTARCALAGESASFLPLGWLALSKESMSSNETA